MEYIHGGDIENAIINYKLKYEDILDFSANINFLGPPDSVIKVLNEGLLKIEHYPQPFSSRLKKNIADLMRLHTENIIIGNGAVELIYLLIKTLKPGKTLIPIPSFSEYELAIRSERVKANYINYHRDRDRGYVLDFDRLLFKAKGVDMIFLTNPNNPTGTLLERKDLIKLLNFSVDNGIYIVIDEAFIDFVDNLKEYTMLNYLRKYKNLFILRSMTKFFAIPGLRLGYGIGERSLISIMEEQRDPWSVNVLSQIAGEKAIREDNYINKSRELNRKERLFLYQGLKKIKGLYPFKPSANFIFIDIANLGIGSGEFVKYFAKKGILIRDCSNYRGLDDSYIRVAVRSRKDNLILLKELGDFCENRINTC
jgi:threonine-phosphate decarboxylase